MESKRKANYKRICLVVQICTTCIQLSALLGMAVYWKTIRMQLLIPKEQDICYPLEKVVSDGDDNYNRNGLTQHFDKKKNRTQLCGTTSKILQMMASKSVAGRYDKDAFPELTYLNTTRFINKCERPSTQKDMVQLTEIASYASPVEGKPTKLFWKKVKSKTNPIHLEKEGVIFINEAGYYFISSHLTIWIENNPDSTDSDGTDFKHFVSLISYKTGTEEILLENAMPKCEIMAQESQRTTKMEAAFWLEQNDRIYVAFSHPHRLVCESLKNNFSVYKLYDPPSNASVNGSL